MVDLASLYKPLTAQAATFNGYMPCNPLKPYIANYWGTAGVSQEETSIEPLLVIPDTCMDVIFDINHTTGSVNGQLCGMDETAFTFIPLQTTDVTSRFAIRFYFWSIHSCSDYHLRETVHSYNDIDLYFKDWKPFFTEMLLSTFTMEERIKKADCFLLSKLDLSKQNSRVMNALYYMLKNQGSSCVKDTCDYAYTSQRQLERLFQEHIGTTIKKTSNLVRYQNLWHDIVFQKHFDVQEAVLKYGYTDQAHLITSFKNYHTMTPLEARKKIY
ncbi:helix-turn-helix domain-containing protein [Lachnospiraceae bacterium 54-53]